MSDKRSSMTNQITPTHPAVPNKPHYGISELEHFERYDRASWQLAHGEQAPPFDPTRPVKVWAADHDASSPKASFITFTYFDQATRKFAKLKLSANDASTPNLKGKRTYPDYEVLETPAVVYDPRAGEIGIDPRLLSHRHEAEVLAEELDASSIQRTPNLYVTQWRGETRRQWLIQVGGASLNAGLLLERKYRVGVGAPGKWVIERTGEPSWICERPETGEGVHGEVPMPCRPLAHNEALYLGHPMKVIVYRTDMESAYNDLETVPFPADMRAAIDRIDANLLRLLVGEAPTDQPESD